MINTPLPDMPATPDPAVSSPRTFRATVTDVRTVVVELSAHEGDDLELQARLAAHEALADDDHGLEAHSMHVVLLEPSLEL